jgi:hypothetical protein
LLAALAGADGECQRAPLCSCCEYRRSKSRIAGGQTPASPGHAGSADAAQSIGPESAYFKVKAACARWVEEHRGFKAYLCHISDAPGGAYRGNVYAANSEITVYKQPTAMCRSGARGAAAAQMRTNVVYECTSPPPSPPPAPPAPSTIRVSTHDTSEDEGVGAAAVGGIVLTVIVVICCLGCFGALSTFLLLGGMESDLMRQISAQLGPTHARRGRLSQLDDDDFEDDSYAFERRHKEKWTTVPPPPVFYGPPVAPPQYAQDRPPFGGSALDDIDED